jgi:hypothetical protein
MRGGSAGIGTSRLATGDEDVEVWQCWNRDVEVRSAGMRASRSAVLENKDVDVGGVGITTLRLPALE